MDMKRIVIVVLGIVTPLIVAATLFVALARETSTAELGLRATPTPQAVDATAAAEGGSSESG